jgi:hypothetical protein
MPKVNCHRKGCTRIRSEFSLFLSRRQPARFEGLPFCSENCLLSHIETELTDRWCRLQHGKSHPMRRPRLGTILLQTSFITPDQLDAAIEMQRTNHEGKLGEWLLRLGFVEERQITMALSKQYGLPVIHLDKSDARTDAVKMVPGKVAKCSNLVPLGFDEEKKVLCIAVCAPVDFNSQEAIRRMLGHSLVTYIGDQSAILSLLERWYEPEDLDLSSVPTYSSQSELIEIGRNIVAAALNHKAENIQMELTEEFFWARIDFAERSIQRFHRRMNTPVTAQEKITEPQLAVASMAIQ